MSSVKSLENRLDNAWERANTDMDESRDQAMDTIDPDDVEAFASATQKVQVTNAVMGQSLRATHGITKSIIDGIQ